MATLQQLNIFPSTLILWLGSLSLHLILLNSMQFMPKSERDRRPQKVAIHIVEKPKSISEPPSPPRPPSSKPKEPKLNSAVKKMEATETSPPTQPVLGLSKDSFTTDGKSGIAVPAGNTTMIEDQGIRLSPDQIKRLDRDLSEDAKLIAGSFIKPEYTQEAEDAGLEGLFIVEVFVNTKGEVTAAELRNKIGKGMDERVLAAARQSKFYPRKNPLGQAQDGWTELKIRLNLE